MEEKENTIILFDHEGNTIEGDENLLDHATKYYTELFGPGEEHNIHIVNSLWAELDQVSDSDNELLSKPFSEEEVTNALFQMETKKAAGPDKIPIEFYQTCWDIVKNDVMHLFHDFFYWSC